LGVGLRGSRVERKKERERERERGAYDTRDKGQVKGRPKG